MNEIIRELKKVPLFASLSEQELDLLSEKLTSVQFKKDDVIIREGDLGDCLYIIKSGSVRVETQIEEVKQPVVLARLEVGDYFGEMALITGEPRSATVVAEEDVTLWRLLKSDFDTLIMSNPQITLSLTHMLSHRLMKTNKTLEQTELQFLKKIQPTGRLEDFGLIRILNFAEQNALTGKIILQKENDEAVFEFEKGQLQKLSYKDLEEDEALDELLEWKEGRFQIKPAFWDMIGEDFDNLPVRSKETERLARAFEQYFRKKFKEFIKFSGSRSVQVALNKSLHKLRNLFDYENLFEFQVQPQLKVDFSKVEKFGEKEVLILSVLLNNIVRYLQMEVIGMDFWDVRTREDEIDSELEKHDFFTLYEQAGELA